MNNYYENNSPDTQPEAVSPLDTTTQAPETDTNNETPFPETNTGRLIVSVFTANQIYPVAGATVTVETEGAQGGEIAGTSVTDRSGRTITFTLPAPSASVSQEPTIAPPFSHYRVSVKATDFFDAVIENVQIFDNILTQLPINLIPLPEITNGETTKFVIIPSQNL